MASRPLFLSLTAAAVAAAAPAGRRGTAVGGTMAVGSMSRHDPQAHDGVARRSLQLDSSASSCNTGRGFSQWDGLSHGAGQGGAVLGGQGTIHFFDGYDDGISCSWIMLYFGTLRMLECKFSPSSKKFKK